MRDKRNWASSFDLGYFPALRPVASSVFAVWCAGLARGCVEQGLAYLWWSLRCGDFSGRKRKHGLFPSHSKAQTTVELSEIEKCWCKLVTGTSSCKGVGRKAVLEGEGGKEKAREDLKLGAPSRCWQKLLLIVLMGVILGKLRLTQRFLLRLLGYSKWRFLLPGLC